MGTGLTEGPEGEAEDGDIEAPVGGRAEERRWALAQDNPGGAHALAKRGGDGSQPGGQAADPSRPPREPREPALEVLRHEGHAAHEPDHGDAEQRWDDEKREAPAAGEHPQP